MWIVEKGLFKTLVYYDCFDYPLTKEELDIFSFAGGDDEIAVEIEESDGFYFLKGRKEIIETRKKRNQIAEKKWEKARKAVKWLQLIPYIRLVFGSGSLALNNTNQESDLDVLIITRHGRVWTSRFLAVVLLGFLGLGRKRHERIAPDKLCLNHFITDKSLHIPRKSIYTAQLYARLVPILIDGQELINEFCEANSWIKEYIAGWPECLKTLNSKLEILNKLPTPSKQLRLRRPGKTQNSKFKTFGEKILDTKFGDWLENILRKYQLRRINSYHLTYKPGGRVKADDESLEFHPDSPELKIIEGYNKKILELGFKNLTEKSSFVK